MSSPFSMDLTQPGVAALEALLRHRPSCPTSDVLQSTSRDRLHSDLPSLLHFPSPFLPPPGSVMFLTRVAPLRFSACPVSPTGRRQFFFCHRAGDPPRTFLIVTSGGKAKIITLFPLVFGEGECARCDTMFYVQFPLGIGIVTRIFPPWPSVIEPAFHLLVHRLGLK